MVVNSAERSNRSKVRVLVAKQEGRCRESDGESGKVESVGIDRIPAKLRINTFTCKKRSNTLAALIKRTFYCMKLYSEKLLVYVLF